MKKYVSRGFTLVELMIVIAIIGILAMVLYPSLMGYMERTRDTTRQQAMNQLGNALGTYFTDMNAYPAAGNNKCLEDIETPLLGTNRAVQYVKVLPKDPKVAKNKVGTCATTGYAYANLTDTSAYIVGAKMEIATNGNMGLDGMPNGSTSNLNDILNNAGSKTVSDAQSAIVEKAKLGEINKTESAAFVVFSR